MSSIPNQVSAIGSTPYANGQSIGGMIGEVNSYATHMGYPIVLNKLNDVVREIYDRRRWYGTMVRGQVSSTGLYSTGTVTVTNGSASVQGVGTNWTATLNGVPIIQQQFRLGFTSPIYSILALDVGAQVITLDMPFGNPTQTSLGYWITQYYFSIRNFKGFFSLTNPPLQYRLVTGLSQGFIDNVDPSRLVMLYPRLAAAMPPNANGDYQFELWPVNTTQQAYPYKGWIQPPNLVSDTDYLPPYIRADAVKAKAIAEVLMYRPKSNPNYSESMCLAVAQQKLKEFEQYMFSMEQADELLWRQNVEWQVERMPIIDPYTGGYPGGAMLNAMTAFSSEDW
jgi:hypothetical protein